MLPAVAHDRPYRLHLQADAIGLSARPHGVTSQRTNSNISAAVRLPWHNNISSFEDFLISFKSNHHIFFILLISEAISTIYRRMLLSYSLLFSCTKYFLLGWTHCKYTRARKDAEYKPWLARNLRKHTDNYHCFINNVSFRKMLNVHITYPNILEIWYPNVEI